MVNNPSAAVIQNENNSTGSSSSSNTENTLPAKTESCSDTTIRMKEYIEATVCTRYKGEALLQRLLHIITTTTTIISSILKKSVAAPDSTVTDDTNTGNTSRYGPPTEVEGLLAVLRIACHTYITVLQQSGNIVRYHDFYQYHYPHLILPLVSFYHTEDSTNTIVPPHDSSWLVTLQQQEQEQNHPMETTMNNFTATSGSASLQVLQQRLHTAQSHLNKDAIRIAYMNLALHSMNYYSPNQNTPSSQTLGENNDYYFYYYTDAIQMSLRSLEYCSTRYHTTLHTILLLVLALYNCNCNTGANSNHNNFAMISDYIRRIQHNLNDTSTAAPVLNAVTNTVVQSFQEKVDTISALERIHSGDYSNAALKLRNIVIQISNRGSGTTAATSAAAAAATKTSGVVSGNSSTNTTVGTVGTTNDITTIEQLIQDENWDTMVLSPDDIIIYATVLTLAVNMDPNDPSDDTMPTNNNNNRKVGLSFLLDNPNMKSLLCERNPFVYDILVSYYMKSDYQHTYTLLQQHVFPILQYDLYLTQMNHGSNSSTNQTHLQILQSMIRTKFMVLYWNVYVECPLASMMESLGTGITGTNNSKDFEALIVQLLKNRFNVGKQSGLMDSSNSELTASNKQRGSNALMTFPMDTRYDYIHKKLIRTNHIYSDSRSNGDINIDNDTSTATAVDAAEQVKLYHTTLQYHRTSQRVLDDTYSMLVRISCIENDIMIQPPDFTNTGGGRYNNKSRRGGSYRPYQPQQQQQRPIHNYEMNEALEQPQQNIPSVDDDDNDDDDDDEMIHNEIVDDDDVDISMDHNNAMNPEDMY